MEPMLTFTGNLVADPVPRTTKEGVVVAGFRLASTPRRLDRGTGEWRDGDTLFVGVSCWRGLGENVLKSLHKGDPVTVTGRLSVHAYTSKDGQERTSVEVEAISVGHDLNRGTTVFTKRRRQDSAAAEETRGEEALGAAEPAA